VAFAPELDAADVARGELWHKLPGAGGALAVLRRPLFLGLYTASFASNVGNWMQDVGASWLMR